MKACKSYKNIHLDSILDKLNSGLVLSSKEKVFLQKWQNYDDTLFRDYRMLSSFDSMIRIQELLENEFEIICNLCDREGPLGLKIVNLQKQDEENNIFLEDGMKVSLKDNILYDLKYEYERWRYSLEAGDEFFELAEINKE